MKCSLLVLSCYLDGELEAARRGEVEAHLVGCPRCRAGLGHLREEVDRVGALARVQVPDHSVHGLLEQLGLLGADDMLPPRSLRPHAFVEDASDLPPWFGPRPGAALPWAPRPDLIGHPQVSAPEPAAPLVAADPGAAADDLDDDSAEAPVELAGSALCMPVEAVGDEPEPDEGGVPSLPIPEPGSATPHPSPAPSVPTPPAPAVPWSPWVAAGATGAWTPGAAVPPPPGFAGLHRTGPAPAAAELPAVVEPGEVETAPHVVVPAGVDRGGASEPALAGPSDDLGALGTGAEDESAPAAPDAPPQPITAAAAGGEGHDPAFPAGGDPVAVRTPQTPPPLYPMTDDDALDGASTVERFAGGPVPAPRAGLFGRLRERFALHRALNRGPRHDLEDGVEIVSGSGAPLRPSRSRADLARRRSEALRPASLGGGPAAGEARDELPEIPRPLLDRLAERTAAIAPPPPAPGAPSVEPAEPAVAQAEPSQQHGLFDPAHPGGEPGEPFPGRLPPAPPVPGTPPRESRPAWQPRQDVEVAGEVGGTVVTRPRRPATDASPSELREGRRLIALFGAAVVVMFAVGVASARSTSPIPTPRPSSTTPPGPAAVAPSKAPAPSAKASAAPSAPAAQPSAPGAVQLTGVKTLGDGGTGWQVQGIRYGDHPGFLRVVLDLGATGGPASGTPKATIGFEDPTTLDVILTGVVPAGGTGSLPNTATVASVTLVTPSPQPGAIVYRLKLAHPVTISSEYVTGPLRLILDLH